MGHLQTAVALDPFWLDGQAGRLFCVSFASSLREPGKHGLLIIPPIGEEMNKCRRMMALAARAAAERGCRSLIVDSFGTGDSEGDFGDACLATWLADLRAAASYLADRGVQSLNVLAVRTGALLIDPSLLPNGVLPGRMALWQPVASGRQFVSQFLRLRLAADVMVGGNSQTTAELRAELATSGSIEIAGYRTSSLLLGELEQRSLLEALPAAWHEVAYFEVGLEDSDSVGPAATQMVNGLRLSGRDVIAQTIAGEPFWATPEVGLAPSLVDATAHYLCGSTQ